MSTSDIAGLQVPVVLLMFNRPDYTRLVFQRVREVRPARLLVVADGARKDRPGEESLCQMTRDIIGEVDWPCQVERNFSVENQGCGRRVSSGLDWVFSQVDEAIILEDDCLPDLTFFAFCETLLARYRLDERVLSISGDNLLPGRTSQEASYRFSRVGHIWGWATWRRAWSYYDFKMRTWPEFRRDGGMSRLFGEYPRMQRCWTGWLEATYLGKIDTWDYQWFYTAFARGGIHILPRRNLVTNIGFSANATHTTNITAWEANLPAYQADQPLRHPEHIAVDIQADRETFRQAVPPFHLRLWRGRVVRRFFSWVKSTTTLFGLVAKFRSGRC